jgi:hypothetical protein
MPPSALTCSVVMLLSNPTTHAHSNVLHTVMPANYKLFRSNQQQPSDRSCMHPSFVLWVFWIVQYNDIKTIKLRHFPYGGRIFAVFPAAAATSTTTTVRPRAAIAKVAREVLRSP